MDPNNYYQQLELQTQLLHVSAITNCMIVGFLIFIVLLSTRRQKYIWLLLLSLMPVSLYADDTGGTSLITDSSFNFDVSPEPSEDNYGDYDEPPTVTYDLGYHPDVLFQDFKNITPTVQMFNIDLTDCFGFDFGELDLSTDNMTSIDLDKYRDPLKLIIKLFVTLFFVSKVWTTLRQY